MGGDANELRFFFSLFTSFRARQAQRLSRQLYVSRRNTVIDAMTTFDRGCYTRLKQAVDALAGVCDGAEARDDEGFDGGDTKAGHLLAFLPLEAWPLSAFHRAWRWTKKYHRQLAEMQIDCGALAEPPLFEGEDRQIALQPDGKGFFVTFPYDWSLLDAFRRIPGNALHTQPIGKGKQVFRYRTVQLVPGAGAALLAFAEQHGFRLGPGVEDLARESCEAVTTLQQEYRVAFDPTIAPAFALYFPRDKSLNEEVKAIPGKAPSYADGFHWVIPATSRAASALLDFLERHQRFFVPLEVEDALRTLAMFS